MAKKSRRWYFVSYYEEYPIRHSEEGGYYTAGTELIESYRVGNLKHARRLIAQLTACYEFNVSNTDRDLIWESGQHIGEGRILRIETVMGSYNKGYAPYQ